MSLPAREWRTASRQIRPATDDACTFSESLGNVLNLIFTDYLLNNN
jgi:hypothetical protein